MHQVYKLLPNNPTYKPHISKRKAQPPCRWPKTEAETCRGNN